jgi:zinc D-Ala-D-Ala dipeptidase
VLSTRSLIAADVLVIASLLFYPDTSIGCPQGSTSTPSAIAQLHLDKSYVDVSNFPNVNLSMRYATDNNFMKKNVYGDFHQCFLHEIAAAKFREAVRQLQHEKPGWKFVVFDCLRPRSIQKKLFEVVKGTAQQPYVANPKTGSIHNYGFAIDLSLEDETGHELDMGTGFDDFSPLSRPDQEPQNREAGKLTPEQLDHRLILRRIMVHAGFLQLPIEWWHYDALTKEEVRGHYKIVE